MAGIDYNHLIIKKIIPTEIFSYLMISLLCHYRSPSYPKMTTVEQEDKITIEGNQIIVENFQTQDYDIVSYFENLEESDNLGQKLENALKIGIVAMKSIGVEGNIKYVEKVFDSLDSNFKQKLDTVFADDGQFSVVLKEHFGEDGKIIKELFDPNREGSPLYTLRLELNKDLSEIRDKLGMDAAVKKVVEKSIQKGFDFEDECEEKLERIAKNHSDKLERTSKDIGKISKSLQGDFVLTLGDIGKRMVFEMKNKEAITLPDIQKELRGAMENREAEYGILVAKSKESLPKSVGWFNEYDGNHLVCAIENGDGDALIDGEIIHIACKWARARLRIESIKEKKLDPSFIIEKAPRAIQKKIGDMRKIKTQCTNIEKSAGVIQETAKNTETEIKNELEEIIGLLDSKE